MNTSMLPNVSTNRLTRNASTDLQSVCQNHGVELDESCPSVCVQATNLVTQNVVGKYLCTTYWGWSLNGPSIAVVWGRAMGIICLYESACWLNATSTTPLQVENIKN